MLRWLQVVGSNPKTHYREVKDRNVTETGLTTHAYRCSVVPDRFPRSIDYLHTFSQDLEGIASLNCM